jgi:hypothetical protein
MISFQYIPAWTAELFTAQLFEVGMPVLAWILDHFTVITWLSPRKRRLSTVNYKVLPPVGTANTYVLG